MEDQPKLNRAIQLFYNDYHKHRVRTPNEWMKQQYWPSFVGKTLEVGGGTLLPEREHFVTIDLSPEAARQATDAGVPALVGNGCELPFPSEAFDTVSCYDVLEHISDPPAFIEELCRVARRRVVIAGPNYIDGKEGGISRHIPAQAWKILNGEGRTFVMRSDPYLTFDEHWVPDRDAVCTANASWVADRLADYGYPVARVRTWEYRNGWLNRFPGVRCVGPFMFVVGERA